MAKCKHDCGKGYYCRKCGRQIYRTLAARNPWSQFWEWFSEPYTPFTRFETTKMKARNEAIDRGEPPPPNTEAMCIDGRLR